MIKLYLGNVGGGKTAVSVKEMMFTDRHIFSNIETKGIKNNHIITKDMIFKKEVKSIKKNGQVIYDLKLNVEFWKEARKKYNALTVIIDEAHNVMNSRRAMSKANIVMGDFLALLRRIVGGKGSDTGELILISQLERRLDPIAKDMATLIKYFKCYYVKICLKCNYSWNENNETNEPKETCPKCGGKYKTDKHSIYVHCFKSVDAFKYWHDFGLRTYFRKYVIDDIQDYFPKYNTLQWNNLISKVY